MLIDGVESRALRRAVKIVPQEAFCFKGTLCENVDPTHAYTDKQIVAALGKTQFWESLTAGAPDSG